LPATPGASIASISDRPGSGNDIQQWCRRTHLARRKQGKGHQGKEYRSHGLSDRRIEAAAKNRVSFFSSDAFPPVPVQRYKRTSASYSITSSADASGPDGIVGKAL
jgi:hypothetical protein